MRDMGEKRRHHGHGHVNPAGFAGGLHGDHEEKNKQEQKLDMSGMSMDTLPHLTMSLGHITILDLSNNNLESIPESIIARLLNVVVLDVRSNQLKSLPNSIGCLSKLKVLNVSGNLLESLPVTIEECRALEELHANFNELTKLPDTLGFELHSLRKLCVNSNKLAHLPTSTSHMTALRTLDARLNCLRELPDGLENLANNLEVLNVSQNFQFLRELPYAVGLLASLRELDVSYNSIAALPDSMGCLTKLVKFSAVGNPLASPPIDIVDQSLDAMRAYLTARMNAPDGKKKKAWLPSKLVKYSTFTARMTPGRSRSHDNTEGLLMSDYRSLNGIASPRFLTMLSPRRLFSPRRNSPKHC
ncbi:hypothetical protein GUJ93_ZPchr0458g22615 [Zizania palustris]|uniref:Uncharacterized protein n=1 Tax=Zizania palustris TaxID=103762 RepID=A0A8J5V2G7_ZIZPA|nr:hypothetical protein GUJ93_ZPchr0458g22615 [Zizania palustris]